MYGTVIKHFIDNKNPGNTGIFEGYERVISLFDLVEKDRFTYSHGFVF